MADNDIDPAASTQMFRAFVDTPEQQTPATAAGGSRTGVITAVVIAVVVVVAAVAWLAFK
ncbi:MULTISPECIES: hypothetical protein [Peterkaempfera]|uniref:hypothetical protein n=1 Tax=Peterkaempfera TaxID=2995704 RepID=UPI0006E34131|nr:hypothetical protein [Peterkaempfera griseoplana]